SSLLPGGDRAEGGQVPPGPRPPPEGAPGRPGGHLRGERPVRPQSVEAPPVQELLPGVYQLAMPIPVPLKVVILYLLPGRTGWTVVDTGFHTPETEARWRLALARPGIGLEALEAVLVTLRHPDHKSVAARVEVESGSP